MANNTSGKMWILDTAGVISTSPVHVIAMYFDPAANSDTCVINDGKGREIITLLAGNAIAGDAQPYDWYFDVIFNGFELSSITANAKLYVLTG